MRKLIRSYRYLRGCTTLSHRNIIRIVVIRGIRFNCRNL